MTSRVLDHCARAALAAFVGCVLLALGNIEPRAVAQQSGAPPQRPYPHGEYKADCTLCHGAEAWSPVKISPAFHHADSGFPLTGAHQSAPCRSCHESLDFKRTPSTCASCHKDVHGGELGPDCARCHTTRNFIDRPSEVSQHRATRFPLTGAHVTLDCDACHAPEPQGKLVFVNTPVECIACHRAQFDATTNPNHAQSGFSTECNQCHTTATFVPAAFDHAASGFPLTGGHAGLACDQCHPGNKFQGISPECVSCHQANYNATTNPPHAAAGFPTNCKSCHSTRAFIPARFDHSTTGFPLTGVHKTLACAACHPNNQYVGTPTACYSCHQNDYAGTTDPNHTAAGFPTDCSVCHTTTGWTGASFDHSKTNFPLTGAHTTVACSSCHINNQYQGTPTDCFACHQADYNNTNNPNHAAAGFSTDCKQCHNTTTFQDARFTQHDALYFPIYSGRHRGTWNACADCHTNPSSYADFSCFLCHDKSSTDSHHSGVSNYSYDSQRCYQCHPRGTAGN